MADTRQCRPQPPPRTKSGAKSLMLPRGEHGFGFTLRHFLIYPPVSYRLRTGQPTVADEPMETMFVKKVMEGTAARAAGLNEGDRLISVNGEQVEGKTYNDVVRMIQNTPQRLHLVVVPTESDVIQQHYRETAHNPMTNARPRNASPAWAETGGRLSVDGASFSSIDSSTDDSAIMSRIFRTSELKEQFLRNQVTPTYLAPREAPGVIAREFYSRPQRMAQPAWPPDAATAPDCLTIAHGRSVEPEQARESRWTAARHFEAEQGVSDLRRHQPTIQLVSERTQQFETGALLDDKIRGYSNELARLSSRVAAPPVAVRRQEFEQRGSVEPCSPTLLAAAPLSGNRTMPIGSSVLHVPPPPGYRDPVLDYQSRSRARSSSTERWSSSFADSPTHSSTPASESRLSHPEDRLYQAITPNLKTGHAMEERLYQSLTPSSTATPLTMEERLCQSLSPVLDKQRHKVVRQESYLAAVKTLPGPTALRARRVIRRESTKELGERAQEDDEVVPVRTPRPTTLPLRVPVNTVPTTSQAEGVVRRGRSALSVDERTCRRISYLKATSGEPTDSPAKSGHMRWLYPMLPGELQRLRRLFEMYSGTAQCEEESPKETSTSDAIKEGLIHWKLSQLEGRRAGDRSWKQMWASLSANMILSLQRDRTAEPETFDVTGWCVDVAENYTKRKHVLRLRAPRDSEYLLQAEDADDAERWRAALPARKASHTELVSSPKSKTWRGKLGMPFRRMGGGAASPSSPTTAYPEGATIGVPLELCPPSPDDPLVPLLVARCTEAVETYGLDTVGVYRVPGNAAAINSFTEAINKGIHNVQAEDLRWRDVNVVSSLIKSFFRSLPDCLFTADLYSRFIEADKISDKQKRLLAIRNLVDQLPVHNSATLHHLLLHLRKIVGNSGVNKMEAMNVAIVFGPTLVRPADLTAMVIDTPHQCHLIESLIRYAEWFFSNDAVESLGLDTAPAAAAAATTPVVDTMSASQANALLLSNLHKLEGNSNSGKDLMASIVSAAATRMARNRPRNKLPASPMTKAQQLQIYEEAFADHHQQQQRLFSQTDGAVSRKGTGCEEETLSMKRFKSSREDVTSSNSLDTIHITRQEEGPDLLASLTETFDQKLQGLKSAEDVTEKTSDESETSATEKAEIENVDEKDCKTRQSNVLRQYNNKVRRSESLNKPDVVDTGPKVRRSESLGKHEYLTKTEKTESNMKARQKRSSCKEKENKRIKRRHTVGGTKDLDKLTWTDNRLLDSRTSSPELSTTQKPSEVGGAAPLESHV